MPRGARVADIGTGSGILAVCAKKLGASYVYGCDNDETVIATAIENAARNNAECRFELNTADKVAEKFDFVCANILHNVLAEITGDLKNLMNTGAAMVLSGILDEKKQVVIDAILKYNLDILEETAQDQWVALTVRRN
jgi:ribosomal protein L11 methyltransferase